MKALTLYDPWATLVVLGEKRFETRSWQTSHRGLLAIHVSRNRPREAKRFDDIEPFRSALGHNYHNLGYRHPGCIIGTVEVVGCEDAGFVDAEITEKERAFGDFGPYRYAWKLSNPQRLKAPIPCKGSMGIWTVPPLVQAQMGDV
jgi:hypothetical protein